MYVCMFVNLNMGTSVISIYAYSFVHLFTYFFFCMHARHGLYVYVFTLFSLLVYFSHLIY